MATYAIGDLQGCYRPFRNLLNRLNFQPDQDKIWLVGDLVNRGEGSLECLRYVRSLGKSAISVLGNHDLSLLALAEKPDALALANDTLKPILCAPDCAELLTWLRHRPLVHYDPELDWCMLHAGLPQAWDMPAALAHAQEVEQRLQADDYPEFLAAMYGNNPDHWSDELSGTDRLRVITNCLTRMRLCHADGRMDMAHKGTLEDAPPHLAPWFTLPGRASATQRIVFGHWSALGQVAWPEYNVWGIDTGCVWGNCMTALRLDTPKPEYVSVTCD